MNNVCPKLIRQSPVRPILQARYDRLHRDGRRLIKGWFEKARQLHAQHSDSTFEAFIFAWIALNGWGACVANTDVDRRWVEAVAFDKDLGSTFERLVKSDPEFRTQAESFRSLWPIFKASEIRRVDLRFADEGAPRADYIDHYLKKGFADFEPRCWLDHGKNGPLDWPHSLVSIYRVRCNLFHGEKSRHSEMDYSIVSASFNVLSTFMAKSALL
jgi:hypothetical protein